jgi:hypothetical protein
MAAAKIKHKIMASYQRNNANVSEISASERNQRQWQWRQHQYLQQCHGGCIAAGVASKQAYESANQLQHHRRKQRRGGSLEESALLMASMAA